MIKSPGRIGVRSPSTVVKPPSLSMTKRTAVWVCRCAGAISFGRTSWIAPVNVPVVRDLPGIAGFSSNKPGARPLPPKKLAGLDQI